MSRRKLGLVAIVTLALVATPKPSAAQTLTTLGSFDWTDGFPTSNLTLSTDGSTLYGTTNSGGDNQYGNVFSVPVSGGTPSVLASFSGGTDGQNPNGGVTLVGSTLYGTTAYGGTDNYGTVFSVPVTGGTPTVLASFDSVTDGQNPMAGLTLVGSTLYGTTSIGGVYGGGTVFSIPVGGGPVTVLASFNDATILGTSAEAGPVGDLTVSHDGSLLYGTTSGGGGADGHGTVFSLPIGGGSPTVLATLNYLDGATPQAGLALSADGSTLYGTATYGGGASSDGDVFSVPTNGGAPMVLGSFDYIHGAYPTGDLTLSGSTLYGTTVQGGSVGGGTVFSLPTTGGTPTVLASFNNANGNNPLAGLTLVGSTLYGTTNGGGENNAGTVFALATPEPSSCVLLGLGAIGFAALAIRRRRSR